MIFLVSYRISVFAPAANVHDGARLIPMIDRAGPIRGRVGAPRCRPRVVIADKAYHSKVRVAQQRARGGFPLLPERGKPQIAGLGKLRWVVERSLSLLHQFKRLRTRWERRGDIHEAFLALAAAFVCQRKLVNHGL